MRLLLKAWFVTVGELIEFASQGRSLWGGPSAVRDHCGDHCGGHVWPRIWQVWTKRVISPDTGFAWRVDFHILVGLRGPLCCRLLGDEELSVLWLSHWLLRGGGRLCHGQRFRRCIESCRFCGPRSVGQRFCQQRGLCFGGAVGRAARCHNLQGHAPG